MYKNLPLKSNIMLNFQQVRRYYQYNTQQGQSFSIQNPTQKEKHPTGRDISHIENTVSICNINFTL